MALLAPGSGCARLGLAPNAHRRRVTATVASLSTSSSSRSDTVDWVGATQSFFERDSRPIMLFDGVCNLCNGGVRFVRENDPNRWSLKLGEHPGESGMKLSKVRLAENFSGGPDELLIDISSVVLVEKNRSYIKSEDVLKIMEYIDVPFPQLAFFLQFVPLFIRDFVYDNVANNRYTIFGQSESCEIYYD